MRKSNNEQINKDDMKILVELQKNSNDSIDTIAKRCGFSRQKVWRSIKQLEENHIIWGYTSVFNEEKIGMKHFIFMAKRTSKQIEKKIVDDIVSRKLEDLVKELGIIIESSAYVHGEYDWIITFTAEDISQAKKFSDSFVAMYPGYVEKVTIIQTLIFIKKQYILNPDKIKLRDFF